MIGVHHNADISIGTSDADARDLCHILRPVAERGICRPCGKEDAKHPDEKCGSQ